MAKVEYLGLPEKEFREGLKKVRQCLGRTSETTVRAYECRRRNLKEARDWLNEMLRYYGEG